jgi:hypothetical protein
MKNDRPRRRREDRQRQPAPVAFELSAAVLIAIIEDDFPDEEPPKVRSNE